MASQQDPFRDCPSSPSSYSLDSGKKTEYLYEFVILFNWDVDLREPFSYHKISLFTDKDIKPQWISKNLRLESRVSKLKNLSPFPGQTMSLFAKIELGKLLIN